MIGFVFSLMWPDCKCTNLHAAVVDLRVHFVCAGSPESYRVPRGMDNRLRRLLDRNRHVPGTGAVFESSRTVHGGEKDTEHLAVLVKEDERPFKLSLHND